MHFRKRCSKNLFLLLILALCVSVIQAQDTKAQLKTALDAKRFSFEVQTVLPTSGSARQVGGSGYNLKLSGDSLHSYLPYFGRVYSAPVGREGGYSFTSTKFDYAVKDKKKGGWEVTIKPKDVPDFREFLLTVSESGTAVLQAMSNNRQPISYNGNVNVQQ